MCGNLGRYLRAAGYDTAIAEISTPDSTLYQQAVHENRHIFTRDKTFKNERVVYLKGEDLDAWAQQLKSEEGVDWLYRPFSRCLSCNAELERCSPPHDVPPGVLKTTVEFWVCPLCHQTFWLGSHTESMRETLRRWSDRIALGLGGDLMVGRLVNEELCRRAFSIWGDLHPILSQTDFNIANLETPFTRSNRIVPKTFNFKADPMVAASLSNGPIHAVNLANNHILDYSSEGLLETIETLDRFHIKHVGAGIDEIQAQSPAILEKKGLRIGVLGCTDNEPSWQAGEHRPGTFYVSVGDLASLQKQIQALRRQVDLVILSIHWGPNMRKRPLESHRSFARALIDFGVDLIHGHSAHVFQGIEIYRNRVILYDTGDLIDDYAIDPILRNDRSFFFLIEANKKGIHQVRVIPYVISDFQVHIAKEKERDDMLLEMQNLSREFGTELQNGTIEMKPTE